EVDVAFERRRVRVLLCLLEQLVEFLLEHLAVIPLGFKLLLEGFLPPAGSALELGDFGGEVLNGLGFLRHEMRDDGPGFGIDFQRRLATGAFDFEQSLPHVDIVSEQLREGGGSLGKRGMPTRGFWEFLAGAPWNTDKNPA